MLTRQRTRERIGGIDDAVIASLAPHIAVLGRPLGLVAAVLIPQPVEETSGITR